MSISSYPKILAFGHRMIEKITDGPVVVEEKVNGSQFSFGKVYDGAYEVGSGKPICYVLECRSNKHELDRIDPDKGYVRGNTRWLTHKENARNRRNTVRIEFNGKFVLLAQVWEESGTKVKYNTLKSRLSGGWVLEGALK